MLNFLVLVFICNTGISFYLFRNCKVLIPFASILPITIFVLLGMIFSLELNKFFILLVAIIQSLILIFLKPKKMIKINLDLKFYFLILAIFILSSWYLYEANNLIFNSSDAKSHYNLIKNFENSSNDITSDMLGGRYHYPYFFHIFFFSLSKISIFPVETLILLFILILTYLVTPFLLIVIGIKARLNFFSILIIIFSYIALDPFGTILNFGGFPLHLSLVLSIYCYFLVLILPNARLLILIITPFILYSVHPVGISLFLLLNISKLKIIFNLRVLVLSFISIMTIFLYLRTSYSTNLRRNIPNILSGLEKGSNLNVIPIENITNRFFNIFSSYDKNGTLITFFIIFCLSIYVKKFIFLFINTLFLLLILFSNLLEYYIFNFPFFFYVTIPFMGETLRIIASYELWALITLTFILKSIREKVSSVPAGKIRKILSAWRKTVP